MVSTTTTAATRAPTTTKTANCHKTVINKMKISLFMEMENENFAIFPAKFVCRTHTFYILSLRPGDISSATGNDKGLECKFVDGKLSVFRQLAPSFWSRKKWQNNNTPNFACRTHDLSSFMSEIVCTICHAHLRPLLDEKTRNRI
jgi:hypothetical protein